VKNPLHDKTNGASANRTVSAKTTGRPGRTGNGLDCEPGFMTRQLSVSCAYRSEKKERSRPAPPGRLCTRADAL
jgi:hypothetical protein